MERERNIGRVLSARRHFSCFFSKIYVWPLRGLSSDRVTFVFNRTGASCHTANVTIDLLRTVFENRIISRNSDVNWLPRSSDLTTLDYFLWGAVKDKCHANHPETIEASKHVIEVAIYRIEAQTIENQSF